VQKGVPFGEGFAGKLRGYHYSSLLDGDPRGPNRKLTARRASIKKTPGGELQWQKDL